MRGMQALRVVMLLITVAFCYLLFVRSQKVGGDASAAADAPAVHSQYKADLDRAHAAAKAIEDARKEAYAD